MFANQINIQDKNNIQINIINNINEANNYDINIVFTTIQKLHKDLEENIKENSSSYDDYKDKKIVLLADESHHLNTLTKSQLTLKEQEEKSSWENTILKILNTNRQTLLLEFTATIYLENPKINEKFRYFYFFMFLLYCYHPNLSSLFRKSYSKTISIILNSKHL